MARRGIPSKDGYRKPPALIRYEQVILMGQPLVPGAIVDQPHIWLDEFHVCHEEQTLYDTLRQRNGTNNQSSKNGHARKAPKFLCFPASHCHCEVAIFRYISRFQSSRRVRYYCTGFPSPKNGTKPVPRLDDKGGFFRYPAEA